MLTYYDYLNRARAATIDKINLEIQQVIALQKKYEAELAALRSLRAEHKRAVVELDSDRVEREHAVAQVNARIRTETQEMKRLQGNEQQVQALLAKLREALVETPSTIPRESRRAFNEMRGQHDWPLRGPILASYGDTKAGGKLQWKGLWIGADEGAPVRATASGRIAYVGWLSSYGLIVVVDHDNGYFTLYGHNASVSKAAGDEVDAGDVIASAGNTGGYEETGLYFEVRRGTVPQDPTSWLRR
jgi:septal ring factor EnvC (AmiA/AmiB activator)